jgi:hypothetical protein
MSRTLLITAFVFTLFSCSKNIEDRLIGEWKLDVAYKKEILGNRNYFQTGFENGVFRFFESGAANYISSNDTLTGFWRSDYYFVPSYNSSTGNSGSDRHKYLEIFLINFQANSFLRWNFDEYSFRNNWKCIRAVEYTLGPNRVYEFVKP